MKKIVIIILMILIILLTGTCFAFFYFVKPRVVKTEIEPGVKTCTDEDGNDIYKKGQARFGRSDDGSLRSAMEDVCYYNLNGKYNKTGFIRESTCDNNGLKMLYMTCGWGYVCRNGACIKGNKNQSVCVDTDGGKNIKVKGEISAYGGTGEDRCWISIDGSTSNGAGTQKCDAAEKCYVSEYFCDGELRQTENIPCPNGCDNGACL